jgi:hypothetical protein
VYYYNGSPVAISRKKARKCDEIFEWVSEKAFKDVKNHLQSLLGVEESFKTLDLEEDLGEGYNLEYAASVIDNILLYKGEKVEFLRAPRTGSIEASFHFIEVLKSSGEKLYIDVRETLTPWILEKKL